IAQPLWAEYGLTPHGCQFLRWREASWSRMAPATAALSESISRAIGIATVASAARSSSRGTPAASWPTSRQAAAVQSNSSGAAAATTRTPRARQAAINSAADTFAATGGWNREPALARTHLGL